MAREYQYHSAPLILLAQRAAIVTGRACIDMKAGVMKVAVMAAGVGVGTATGDADIMVRPWLASISQQAA